MSSSNTASPSKTTSSNTPSTQSQPLADLSPNTTSPLKSIAPSIDKLKDEMPTTAREQAATYISPSDAMLSPTTKKLSEIKGRRFASAKTGQMGSRALFQKAVMQGKENGAVPRGAAQ